MFGNNPIRKSEVDDMGITLAVQEVFETIQGEGPQQGRPCVFVRLAGCNLACTFCDTDFESNITNVVPVPKLVKQIMEFRNHSLVVLTGGEPMRQNIVPLIQMLWSQGVRMVQIETAGTLWVPGLEPWLMMSEPKFAVQIVCSPKTPRIHHNVERFTLHYKYVVEEGKTSTFDGLPIFGTQMRNQHETQCIARTTKSDAIIWVSPCDAHDPDKTARNTAHAVAVAMKFGHRLSLQQHKILGLP